MARNQKSTMTSQTPMAEAEGEEDLVPEELEEPCLQCHHALAAIDRLLKPALANSRLQMEEKLDSVDAASHTLLLTYTMNSLFWVYLSTQGINPKSHPVKRELERIQKTMRRAKTVTERKRGAFPRVNQSAAKRFVRNALWEEGGPRKRKHTEDEETPPTKKQTPTSSSSSSQ